jgi:hypothetical protein
MQKNVHIKNTINYQLKNSLVQLRDDDAALKKFFKTKLPSFRWLFILVDDDDVTKICQLTFASLFVNWRNCIFFHPQKIA